MPLIASKFITSSKSVLLFFAYNNTASAIGCSDFFSSEAKADNKSFSLLSDKFFIEISSGFPFVIVPVLSTTTVLTLWSFSSVAASLIKIPSLAPLPTPTIIAVGVARPKAHGQAITRTPTNDTKQNESASENPKNLDPIKSHAPKDKKAIIKTIGTKTPEILSASA